jgi:hypothetical protein
VVLLEVAEAVFHAIVQAQSICLRSLWFGPAWGSLPASSRKLLHVFSRRGDKISRAGGPTLLLEAVVFQAVVNRRAGGPTLSLEVTVFHAVVHQEVSRLYI